eukprot:TRINITY_DN9938_c0_g1_i4.p1 TRINITY_DN9938_c0_g1~~TRINITY_DN9938_c0_g1_i4.p1  ORF type:complete len:811 (+),score=225.05 TRINITY_DN9938_c0_g1_i4:292-2724(+)
MGILCLLVGIEIVIIHHLVQCVLGNDAKHGHLGGLRCICECVCVHCEFQLMILRDFQKLCWIVEHSRNQKIVSRMLKNVLLITMLLVSSAVSVPSAVINDPVSTTASDAEDVASSSEEEEPENAVLMHSAPDLALLGRFGDKSDPNSVRIATNQYAVKLRPGSAINKVASDLGMTVVGSVFPEDRIWVLEKPIKNIQALKLHLNLKKNVGDNEDDESETSGLLMEFLAGKESAVQDETVRDAVQSAKEEYEQLGSVVLKSVEAHEDVQWVQQQVAREMAKKATVPSDPYFGNQWHLRNIGQNGATPGIDVNVYPVWEDDIVGTNIVVGVVDDGVDIGQPDLSPNYQSSLSFDFNNVDNDPSPVKTTDNHGTACAGAAVAKDNSECGVGVAFRSGLAGLRLISDPVTDLQESLCFGWKNQDIDVLSNSWGPPDDAKRLTAPGTLAAAALKDAVTKGRGGKGVVIMFAAGNGLPNNDNCNYDGYANSIHTLAVGAVDMNGVQASGTTVGSEPCAAMHVVAPSKGDQYSTGILTTDRSGVNGYVGGTCLSGFGGTSAATAIASGSVALLLSSNPALTYRDVMHIFANTAKKVDNSNADWKTNPVGWRHSHIYGFGLIDTAAAVKEAENFQHVPALVSKDSGVLSVNQAIPDNSDSGMTGAYEVRDSDNIITEHVEVIINVRHASRGQLDVRLFKNRGNKFEVESILATKHADTNADYTSWSFKTLRHWGESSKGTYTIQVSDREAGTTGTFDSWQMIVHGTEITANNPENPIVDPNDTPWEPYAYGFAAFVAVALIVLVFNKYKKKQQSPAVV